jgi:hypothetical protein
LGIAMFLREKTSTRSISELPAVSASSRRGLAWSSLPSNAAIHDRNAIDTHRALMQLSQAAAVRVVRQSIGISPVENCPQAAVALHRAGNVIGMEISWPSCAELSATRPPVACECRVGTIECRTAGVGGSLRDYAMASAVVRDAGARSRVHQLSPVCGTRSPVGRDNEQGARTENAFSSDNGRFQLPR